MRPVFFFHRLVLPVDGLHEFFRFAEILEHRVDIVERRVQPHQLFLGRVAVWTTCEVAADEHCSESRSFFELQVALCTVEIVRRKRRQEKVRLVARHRLRERQEVRVWNLREFSFEVLEKIGLAENVEVDAPVGDVLANPRDPCSFEVARDAICKMPETARVHYLRDARECGLSLRHSEQRLRNTVRHHDSVHAEVGLDAACQVSCRTNYCIKKWQNLFEAREHHLVVILYVLCVRSDNRRKVPKEIVYVGHQLETAFLLELGVVQRNLCAARRRRLLQNHRARLLERVFVGADDFGDGRDDIKVVLAHELEERQNAANPVRLRHVVRMHDYLLSVHSWKSSKKMPRI